MAGERGEREYDNRMDFLFDEINRGVTADEAYRNWHLYIRTRKKSWEIKGEQSVINTIYAIHKLHFVKEIEEYPSYSPEDLEYKDLRVSIGVDEDRTEDVFVQVKSSRYGVKIFRQEICKAYILSSPEFTRWMFEKRLILIVGSEDEDKIRDGFTIQLEQIEDYWRNKNSRNKTGIN